MTYEGIDYNLQFIKFPNKIYEVVTPNEDGSYTIFIDNRLDEERRRQAFLHAINHIKSGDFYRKNVQSIESEAHT